MNVQYERLCSKRRSNEGYVASRLPNMSLLLSEICLLNAKEEVQSEIINRTERCHRRKSSDLVCVRRKERALRRGVG
jgi:hypothetical protein